MTKYINKISEGVFFCIIILLTIYLAFFNNYSYAVIDGIKLWFTLLVPTLFPYLFISFIISNNNYTYTLSNKLSPLFKRTFNLSGLISYCFILSVLSGYPIGAKTVSELKEKKLISDSESVRASALCATSSPTFLISCIGCITFNNKLFGILLFISNLLSAIIIGFIFSFYKRKDKPVNNRYFPQKKDDILFSGISSSVLSILFIGGIITVFYFLTEILFTLKITLPLEKLLSVFIKDENLSRGIISGLFECTKGLKIISLCEITIFTLPIVSAICGFGGLSVIVQSITFLKEAKIKTAPFILSRILSAVINFIISLFFSVLFF